MRTLTRFLIPVFLSLFAVASAQLPPEIMVDKHLIEAEQLHAAKDYTEAFKVMEKVIALEKEHSLTLPVEFHFKYARVALAADSTRIALESATRYLSATGKGGEFYKEALTLILKAEGNYVMTAEEFYNEVIKVEGTCGDRLPKGSSCWMELTSHPGCYVWIPDLEEGATMVWSGRCSGHSPEGEGTLTMEYIYDRDSEGRPKKTTGKSTGSFQKGRRHGKWVYYYRAGSAREEGPYVEGKRHGQWVEYYEDSVAEGPYVEGKKHGLWIGILEGSSDGTYWYKELYWHHERRDYWESARPPDTYVEHEGPDENGNGHIIYRTPDGAIWGGAYVKGKRHGEWVMRHPNGGVSEVAYVEGKGHGQLIMSYPDGIVGGGAYVDGKQHGEWIEGATRRKSKGRYVNGKKVGTWLTYYEDDGDCWAATYKDSSVTSGSADKEKCRQVGLIP